MRLGNRKTSDKPSWAFVATARGARGRGAGGHPQTIDRLRAYLAHHSLWRLITMYAVALLVGGFLIGLGLELTETGPPRHSLGGWWIQGFTLLLTLPLGGATADGGDTTRQLVQAAGALTGVVLTSIFLGAVVFKLFVSPEVFVVRDRIALVQDSRYGECLAIRLYSGTQLRLIDVKARCSLHAEVTGSAERKARYHPLTLAKEEWPLAHTHIPYTIFIPLLDGDIERAEEPRLRAIRGLPFSPLDFVMVTLTATAPELGSEIAETHVFELSDTLSFEAPHPITPDPARSSSEWEGWEHFDES